jgi:SNF2 family DNA or RNA helicase
MPQHDIKFQKDDWLVDIKNPGQPGRYTGQHKEMGTSLFLQLEYGPQESRFRPLNQLQRVQTRQTARTLLEKRLMGRAEDLRRLITFEKLKGTLDEVIYSMEAAQIDFLPYQFKPVLKFNQSRTQRLLLADEVGLGKTIESGLIWLEMQARSDAKRLLVVCKKTLCFNWAEELRSKFGIDTIEGGFNEISNELKKLKADGPNHSFAVIISYDALRADRKEWEYITTGDDSGVAETISPKGKLLRELKEWHDHFKEPPFDLTIFDEAAMMKNPAAMRTRTGGILADASSGALAVTATPLMVGRKDLQTLLKLVDVDVFDDQYTFNTLLEENQPAVRLANALASIPVQVEEAKLELKAIEKSRFIGNSPLIPKLKEELDKIKSEQHEKRLQHTVIAQGYAEKLNVLGSFMTRTRRVQVQELRTEREPVILTVFMTDEERKFYWAVIEHVRNEAAKNDQALHVFQQIGIQMRCASCIPALANEMRSKNIRHDDGLLDEVLDVDVNTSLSSNDTPGVFDEKDFQSLLTYNFEKNDTKFKAFEAFVDDLPSGEKIVLFAYYRGTLSYLSHRLEAKGKRCSMIHGGIGSDDRKTEIEQFRDDPEIQFLLSSEVGSEGLNLQFARILVNYDLPWNPMKVEQRIGRLDRVGQESEKINIIHFKTKDTIEERLYDRLHQRLELFKNSVGDLADVLGQEIQKLTAELISTPLSESEMNAKLEQAGIATANKLELIRELENESEGLLAFSDYLQSKIRDDLQQERYLTPDELESYISDFFQTHYQGTEIQHASPVNGCLTIRLSQHARQSLDDFIGRDTTQRSKAVRGSKFTVSFRRSIIKALDAKTKRQVAFINHLSPLVQWITEERKAGKDEFIPTSATQLSTNQIPPGVWLFYIEHWQFKGIQESSRLAYVAARIGDDSAVTGSEAEVIARNAMRYGNSWYDATFDTNDALCYADILSEVINEQRDIAYQDFKNENITTADFRKRRIEAQRDRMVQSISDTLSGLVENKRKDSIIRATEGRLTKTQDRFERKLSELSDISDPDISFSEVALGICLVTSASIES